MQTKFCIGQLSYYQLLRKTLFHKAGTIGYVPEYTAHDSLRTLPRSPWRNLSKVQMGKPDLECVDILTSYVHTRLSARLNYEHDLQGDVSK
jgi:hypothetical protein